MVGKREERGQIGEKRKRKEKVGEGEGMWRKALFLVCLTYLPPSPEASCIFPSPSATLMV